MKTTCWAHGLLLSTCPGGAVPAVLPALPSPSRFSLAPRSVLCTPADSGAARPAAPDAVRPARRQPPQPRGWVQLGAWAWAGNQAGTSVALLCKEHKFGQHAGAAGAPPAAMQGVFSRCFPAGEYNLRLGIMKELRPEMVATHQARACLLCLAELPPACCALPVVRTGRCRLAHAHRRTSSTGLALPGTPPMPATAHAAPPLPLVRRRAGHGGGARGPRLHCGGRGQRGRQEHQAGAQHPPLRQPHPAAVRGGRGGHPVCGCRCSAAAKRAAPPCPSLPTCPAPATRCTRPQGGSDVVTRTALKRINWSSYKINQNSDKVGLRLNWTAVVAHQGRACAALCATVEGRGSRGHGVSVAVADTSQAFLRAATRRTHRPPCAPLPRPAPPCPCPRPAAAALLQALHDQPGSAAGWHALALLPAVQPLPPDCAL